MTTSTAKASQGLTASDVSFFFREKGDVLEKMVDDICQPAHDDDKIPGITTFFQVTAKKMPNGFALHSKEEQAWSLFYLYANERIIVPITKDKRYSAILDSLKGYFSTPECADRELKVILLDRVKMLHSMVIEIALCQALSVELEGGFLNK